MVFLFLILFAIGIIDTVLSVSMMVRVNGRLPNGHKLAWWRRENYWGKVNRLYGEHFPESILPGLESYLSYTVIAFLVILVLVSFYKGRIG
jgi:hypothetical protein